MKSSLQTRFFLFLLLPVTIVLLGAGYASLMYARATLQSQWTDSVKLRLEKTAHQIQMRVDEKQSLIDLIVQAEEIPNGSVTQAFLIQKLANQPGVRSVDVDPVQPTEQGAAHRFPSLAGGGSEGSPDFVCLVYQNERLRYSKDPSLVDVDETVPPTTYRLKTLCSRSLRSRLKTNFLSIVKKFGGAGEAPTKRLVVTVRFDSLLDNILEVGKWAGGSARLMTRDGTYLARTDRASWSGKPFGKSGDSLERTVLKEMQTKNFGTILSEGLFPKTVVGFLRIPSTDWYLVLFSPGNDVFASISRFHFNYLFGGLATMIFVGLLIRGCAKSVSKHIGEISEAASKVEEGDLSVALAANGFDEISQLNRRFNLMVDGLRRKELIEHTFGWYVDRKIANELLENPEGIRLGGENHVATILMADLRGFSQAAEKLRPEQVTKLLNRHFSAAINVIEKYEGIVVDFYGDSVLAFFNGLESDAPARAADAVNCALEMQRECAKAAQQNLIEGLPSLAMGVGIHTGEVVVGNIGSERRAKYGIVGSAVNETDRIQAHSRGGSVIISGQTYELLSHRVVVGPKSQVRLKGLDTTRDLYPVLSMDMTQHGLRFAQEGTMAPRHS
ncbi:MAG: adenylate/guanylate cyclase domain-containing protein [Deltaproteobacteria bacterium]